MEIYPKFCVFIFGVNFIFITVFGKTYYFNVMIKNE